MGSSKAYNIDCLVSKLTTWQEGTTARQHVPLWSIKSLRKRLRVWCFAAGCAIKLPRDLRFLAIRVQYLPTQLLEEGVRPMSINHAILVSNPLFAIYTQLPKWLYLHPDSIPVRKILLGSFFWDKANESIAKPCTSRRARCYANMTCWSFPFGIPGESPAIKEWLVNILFEIHW